MTRHSSNNRSVHVDYLRECGEIHTHASPFRAPLSQQSFGWITYYSAAVGISVEGEGATPTREVSGVGAALTSTVYGEFLTTCSAAVRTRDI